MDALFNFLLTEWAGAPLVIWFVGSMAILGVIVVLRARRIKVKPLRGEIEIDNDVKTKPKKSPPAAAQKPKRSHAN